MAIGKTEWHGTQQESFDLLTAIAHHCECKRGLMGVRLSTCSPHEMMLNDQRALDGMLFARRTLAERMRREEFSPGQSR